MAIDKREGVLDRVSEKGVVLGGTCLSYSKWFEGERLTEASLGSKLTVLVDAGEKCSFLKRVLEIGEKVLGWNPPSESQGGSWGGGGGRRLSPEELELKRAEGVRIARCCAIERAVEMAERGIAIEKIAPHARALEEYFLTGNIPTQATKPEKGERPKEVPPALPRAERPAPPPPREGPPSKGKPEAPPPPAKPIRLESRAVNALFNEAKRAGLVAGWQDYESLIRKVLGVEVKDAYHLSPEEFAKFESSVRPHLKAA